jgi:multicomponent Na+:H+ antiporter subunit B
MKHNLILKIIAKFLIPLIFLFALYVQFHGDFGPGGGFQAGVIFSAGLILYTLVLRLLASLGVLIYAGTGIVGLVLGGKYLEFSVLGSTRVAGQHLGIVVVELGVGMTVMSAMLLIFFAFAERGQSQEPLNKS